MTPKLLLLCAGTLALTAGVLADADKPAEKDRATVIAQWELNEPEASEDAADTSGVEPAAHGYINDTKNIRFAEMFGARGLYFTAENIGANNYGNRVECDNSKKLNEGWTRGLRAKMRLAFTGKADGQLFNKNVRTEDGKILTSFVAFIRHDPGAKPNTLQFMVSGDGTEMAASWTNKEMELNRLYDVEFVYVPSQKLEILIDGEVAGGTNAGKVPASLFARSGPLYIGSHVGNSPLGNVFVDSLVFTTAE